MEAAKGPLQSNWFDKMLSPGSLDYNPGYLMLDALSRVYSPYQINPSNFNPLRAVIEELVDFEALRASSGVKLYVCASNVTKGRIKVFDKSEISADAVMASACLPFLYQAVQIGDDHYWDGGYMGNPPIFPLIYNCESRDILIVQLNPVMIPEVPRTAQAILDRINTLSFNSSLMREMRAISFVARLVDNGYDDGGKLRKLHIHTVDAESELSQLGVSSKLNADWDFLLHLYSLGRERGEAFVSRHYDDVGVRSSTAIQEKFL
jgi:NTE family protein